MSILSRRFLIRLIFMFVIAGPLGFTGREATAADPLPHAPLSSLTHTPPDDSQYSD